MSRGRYIVGPLYDWAFFLLPPLASVAVGFLLSGSAFDSDDVTVLGRTDTGTGFLLATIVHAHLVAVVFRSHANPSIFRLYPARFIVVPILLYTALSSSAYLAAAAAVVATFWDVWHSAAQTFGFARIYDRNLGHDPEVGRRWDFWLNQVLYTGPVLAGATLMDHVSSFHHFDELGATFFSAVPVAVEGVRKTIVVAVIAASAAFVVAYVAAYARLWRRGYRFPREKVFLLASTAVCSIVSWGFNTWGEAFLIMNLFHAVQYLALVWAREKAHIARTFHVPGRPRLALALFLGSILLYGLGVEIMDPNVQALWAVTLVVSLMHFWYDAFIWSVRRGQI